MVMIAAFQARVGGEQRTWSHHEAKLLRRSLDYITADSVSML